MRSQNSLLDFHLKHGEFSINRQSFYYYYYYWPMHQSHVTSYKCTTRVLSILPLPLPQWTLLLPFSQRPLRASATGSVYLLVVHCWVKLGSQVRGQPQLWCSMGFNWRQDIHLRPAPAALILWRQMWWKVNMTLDVKLYRNKLEIWTSEVVIVVWQLNDFRKPMKKERWLAIKVKCRSFPQ